MRKLLYLSAVMMAVWCGCSDDKVVNDDAETNNEGGNKKELYATLPKMKTRAFIQPGNANEAEMVWQEGDALTVFDAEGNAEVYKLLGKGGNSKGRFITDNTEAGEADYVVFPNETNPMLSNNLITLNLPQTLQTEKAMHHVPLFGQVMNERAVLSNLTGVLKLNIDKLPQEYNQLILKASKPVAGVFVMNPGNLSQGLKADAKNTDAENCNLIVARTEATKLMYIPLPEGNYEQIQILGRKADKEEVLLTEFKDKVITKGMIEEVSIKVSEAEMNMKVFDLLNLDYPGLENVKSAYQANKPEEALANLLTYYRNRTSIKHPDMDVSQVTITSEEQRIADDAMKHTFYVHKGYPSYNYGEDINWEFWPVKDNELRWQLHRQKWFVPMGKAYRVSGDEKYAEEWVYQYMDWIVKNPIEQKNGTAKEKENFRFAWRPLEVSERMEAQLEQFLLFVDAKAFTPAFLSEFLVNYAKHASYIMGNYSKEGNHLLFEGQRMVYGGVFFPELKDATNWKSSGVNVLNTEIKKQVYEDGGQFELDPGYHLASINIFCKALRMATINNFKNDFPNSYLDIVQKMIEFYANICYPDYMNPCFSDAKLGSKRVLIRNYNEWLDIYPDCEWIKWFATEGRSGSKLNYLSHASLKSGFMTFRNSWDADATVMVIKAGPKGEWHCQPDNGTFELWFKGKNLFPDSGSFVYGGEGVEEERNWFRQTQVHNTLTLNGKNLETTQSETRVWKSEGDVQCLVTENPHYKGLRHRRSVFFVDQKYFVLVDEAIGNATGTVNLNYHLCEGTVKLDKTNHSLQTEYSGLQNAMLFCFADGKDITLTEKEGWRSTAYKQKVKRTSVSFDCAKKADETVRYITLIYPVKKANATDAVRKAKASFIEKSTNHAKIRVEIELNDGSQLVKELAYQL